MIRKLDCYEPTSVKSDIHEAIKTNKKAVSYFKLPNHFSMTDSFYHYPMLVDPDGSPWVDANRYLLSRLNGVIPAKHRTLESIAGDLASFREWLLDEEVDYLLVPPRPRVRPTYRYCNSLHNEIRLGTLKPSTAKRRVSSLQNFYRWLELDGHIFEYPLWIESNASLMFKDSRGFHRNKAITSTDLTRSFRNSKQKDDYSQYIDDGGKLRPLPKSEQIALTDALKSIENTEMSLAFLFALATGARLQTVFTLRRSNFIDEYHNDTLSHRLKIGSGTNIDTKNGKQMVLLVPLFVYRRIQLYMSSERCLSRLKKSKHVYPNESDQYLFLTKTGQPYYMAESDPFAFLYRSPPRGNAITQFIRQQLKPKLIQQGHNFEIRFHDLRATFGMNLLESKFNNASQSQNTPSVNSDMMNAIMLVKTRMGHTQLTTTQAYLNYQKKYNTALNLQSDFESYLEDLVAV